VALDVETTSSYTLIVTAKDGGTPSLTGTTTCYVTISDVDEFPTEFLSAAAGSIYTKSLSEDTIHYQLGWLNCKRQQSLYLKA
jgi:cadherin EGF LAG seven-pass G-type receptor 1